MVQLDEIFPSCRLSVNTAHQTPSCAREKRDCSDGVQNILAFLYCVRGILAASRSFGLVPVDIIRGRVHIVPADVCISLPYDDVVQKIEVDGFNDSSNDQKKDKL